MFQLHIHVLSSFSILHLLIAGFTLFFAIKAMSCRGAVGCDSFIFLMLAMTFYSGGYALELASADLPTALFFSNVQYFGIPFIPLLLYNLIWKYLHRTNVMPLKARFLLPVVPVITFFLHLTSSRHTLFYLNPELFFRDGLSILSFEKGLWYNVGSVYTFLLVLVALVYSFVSLLKNKKYRIHIASLFLASAFPFGGFLLYVAGVSPEHLDITPLSLGLSCPFLALAIFHASIFDIVPVARDHIFEYLKNGLIVTDSTGRLIDYNGAALEMFPEIGNYPVGSFLKNIRIVSGQRISDLHCILSEADIFTAQKDCDDDEHYYSVRKDVIASTKQFFGGVIYLVTDITEEKKLQKKLQHMATTDALTQIMNRGHLIETGEKELVRAMRYKRDLAVVFFDVDHFKRINDSYGHLAGDRVLVELCSICKSRVRESDHIGRYGGEEFVLILPETTYDAAFGVAEKLRSAVEKSVVVCEEQTISVTASFGVASYKDGESLDALFNRADQSLYRAKEGGRNRVC